MRLKYITNALGTILSYIGAVMFVPVVVACIYAEWNTILHFILAGLISLAIGDILKRISKDSELNDIKKSEALIIASCVWVTFGIIASVPFLCEGFSIIDSLFEGFSGITTTGATILQSFDISKTLLFWRSFTQWLGGMGIIVLFVAILPQFAVAGRQMFYAEAPGPTEEKLTPRIKNTASALWIVYAGLTLICAICLKLAGMPVFDSICNAMSTLSAGGFSPNSRSIGGYNSNAIVWIITVFIFISGTNFVLQSKVLTKFNPLLFFKSEEFKFYIKMIFSVSLVLALILYFENNFNIIHSIQASLYQVLSLSTSTGSSSEDYHLWGLHANIILFIAMFLSSCSGSAGGGIKMTRWLLIIKYLKIQLYKILHPKAVISIKIDERVVAPEVIRQTVFFVFCFFVIFSISAILFIYLEQNVITGMSAGIASLGIVGPGLGDTIGPMGSYATLQPVSKCIFILNMLIGRLEIIPFIVLFQKDIWNFKE